MRGFEPIKNPDSNKPGLLCCNGMDLGNMIMSIDQSPHHHSVEIDPILFLRILAYHPSKHYMLHRRRVGLSGLQLHCQIYLECLQPNWLLEVGSFR